MKPKHHIPNLPDSQAADLSWFGIRPREEERMIRRRHLAARGVRIARVKR